LRVDDVVCGNKFSFASSELRNLILQVVIKLSATTSKIEKSVTPEKRS
jgi:hypothetical protein